MARGDIVELDLFSLGCPAEYDFKSPSWTTDFDLGVTFTEISHVYIDWSGEITAELVAPCGSPPDTPAHPLDGLFVATLYEPDPHDYFGRAYAQAGQATSPDPEPFELRSAFTDEGWSVLLDGRGAIEISLHIISRPLYLCTVEYPCGQLDSATLVLEGTVIPEPATILLLAIGIAGIQAKHHNKSQQDKHG